MIRVWRGRKSPRGLVHPFVPEGYELIAEYETMDRLRVVPDLDPVSLTKQAHALETDVQKIVSRYRQTGVWLRNGRTPMYGDFTGASDYHAAYNRVLDAQQDFLHLPAAVRRAASHDPGVFLDMLADPEGRKVLDSCGLDGRSVPNAGAREGTSEEVVPPDPSSDVASQS